VSRSGVSDVPGLQSRPVLLWLTGTECRRSGLRICEHAACAIRSGEHLMPVLLGLPVSSQFQEVT
jgi:hypothetical protein